MVANVMRTLTLVRGYIAADPTSDLYVFELEGAARRWTFKGKRVGETFISADDQGYEHIPQEFYAALDAAWHDPHGHVEFPDPFLDDLAVQGT